MNRNKDVYAADACIFLFTELKSEDKEPTVFIDLRNFEQIRQEQQQSIEKVQKVLGIDPNER